jgi:serine/threonine protein kinase
MSDRWLSLISRADRNIISWPLQATEIIRYIHSKGIIHCDVDIHNFLVQDDSTLALADFGGSRVDGSKSQEAGLPRYKRPTLARDSDPTEMDDLFSFKMVIYKIKTGQMAYTGKNNSEIRKLLASRNFPNLAFLVPGWRVVISKCWQEGYNNVEEILINLNNLFHSDRRKFVISQRPDLLLYYFIRLSAAAAIIVVFWHLLSRR